MAPKYALSDSESEADANISDIPSDETLEQSLRNEVISRWKAGRQEELTVKRVRLAVEQELKLEEGFFKNTGDWKSRSEEIIRNTVEEQDAGEELEDAPESAETESPPSPKKAAPKRSKAETAPKPRKRQKTATPVSEEDEEPELSGDDSEEEEAAKPKPKPQKRATAPVKKSKAKPAEQEALSEASDEAKDEPESTKATTEATKDDSESEMSVVFDEEPKPAPKRQKTSAAPKEKKKAAPKAKDEDVDPDQAEIKRLQGWLVKCGIRKMWWRELQPYDTSKAKIKHLKQMLEDAGMKGRYSLDKARQIRDERELKADLEQIQQGAKDWGKTSGDEGEGGDAGPPPRRAAARGRQALAFLESDDGEETD